MFLLSKVRPEGEGKDQKLTVLGDIPGPAAPHGASGLVHERGAAAKATYAS